MFHILRRPRILLLVFIMIQFLITMLLISAEGAMLISSRQKASFMEAQSACISETKVIVAEAANVIHVIF